MSTVVPLLGWVGDLGSFRSLFVGVAVPGLIALIAFGTWLATQRAGSGLAMAMRVGVAAGLLGTLGYDLFRVPFVFGAGFRLLAPIESYGVLLLGADASSGLTDFAGWTYHVSNGVLFGIAYAVLAFRRHWLWGLAWALVLETGTLVTPFANAYQLWGAPLVIVLAYAAHVPYGLAVGFIVQRGDDVAEIFDRWRLPVTKLLGFAVFALAVWLDPWATSVDPGPSSADIAITDARFVPEFTRVADGSCATVLSSDQTSYRIDAPNEVVEVDAETPAELCYPQGVHRVRTTGAPFDGGFLIVESSKEG